MVRAPEPLTKFLRLPYSKQDLRAPLYPLLGTLATPPLSSGSVFLGPAYRALHSPGPLPPPPPASAPVAGPELQVPEHTALSYFCTHVHVGSSTWAAELNKPSEGPAQPQIPQSPQPEAGL